MNELRDDLTIGEIVLYCGKVADLLVSHDGCKFIGKTGCKHDIPTSWLKLKVKKWVAKNIVELREGDILIRNGSEHEITALRYINAFNIRIKYGTFSFIAHKNEFVTVEVEE